MYCTQSNIINEYIMTIQIIFVHQDVQKKFLDLFVAKGMKFLYLCIYFLLVDALKMGLPWEKDVKITPLPGA